MKRAWEVVDGVVSGGGLVEGEGDVVRGVKDMRGSGGRLSEGDDGRGCSKLSKVGPCGNSAPGAGVGDVLGKADEVGEELEGEEGGEVGAEIAAL